MQFLANKEFHCLTDLLSFFAKFSSSCVYWMWWSAAQAPASGYCEPNVTCWCSTAACKPAPEAELSEQPSLKKVNILEPYHQRTIELNNEMRNCVYLK